MPLSLKIVIGLIVVAIVLQVVSIAMSADLNDPISYIMNVLWIIVWIGIIRGFLNRSNISRYLAIGITIIGLLASLYVLYMLITVPFAEQKDFAIAIVYSIIAIFIQVFVIFSLFSGKVVEYFVERKSKVPNQ